MHLYKYGTASQQVLCNHDESLIVGPAAVVLRGPVRFEARLDTGFKPPVAKSRYEVDSQGLLAPPTFAYPKVTLDFNRDRVLFSVVTYDDAGSIYCADLVRQSSEWLLVRCSIDYPSSTLDDVVVEQLEDEAVCRWLERHQFFYASEWQIILKNEPALVPVMRHAIQFGFLSKHGIHPAHSNDHADRQLENLKGIVGSLRGYEAFVAIVRHVPEAIGWNQHYLSQLVGKDRSSVSRYKEKYLSASEYKKGSAERDEARRQRSVQSNEKDDD